MLPSVAHEFRLLAEERGGLVNAHSHLDIAYILDLPGVAARLGRYVGGNVARSGELPLRTKIDELDVLLRQSDEHAATLGERIRRAVADFQAQGCRAARTCFTVGTELATGPLEEAAAIRDDLRGSFTLQLAALPLRSLAAPAEFRHFSQVCGSGLIDVVGALPQGESGDKRGYLDRLLDLAAGLDKPIEVHVDEYLAADERETQTLAAAAAAARARGYARGVAAVHAITLAAHPPDYRKRVAAQLAEADVAVVTCPRAAISMQDLNTPTYLHNAIAPIRDLLDAGVTVAIGTDNIRDIFVPLSGGSLAEEADFLAEATRIYDLERLAGLAASGGAAVLGLPSPGSGAAAGARLADVS
jgi:cytosine/creatinine deaminase